jgi:hypothetical protein
MRRRSPDVVSERIPMSTPKAIAVVAIGVALLATSAPSVAVADETPPEFTYTLLAANGSACRLDPPSITTEVLPGGDFVVRYRTFVVRGGDYQSCTLIGSVAVPEGWTYAIPAVSHRGLVVLGAGASARFRAAAWFTGYPVTVTDSQQVDGPYDDYWDATTGWSPTTWAPCGTAVNLTVNALARVVGQPEDSATMVSTTIHRPMWRLC